MNYWIRRSIDLANARGYLDRLHKVYPVTREPPRRIPEVVKQRIREAFDAKDDTALVKECLKLDKFPTKDPYAAFLRKKRGVFVEMNPRTVRRIAEELYSMGFPSVIRGIEEPKEFNRQIGTLFSRWLHTLGYPFLAKAEFNQCEDIAFLDGTGLQLKEYANTVLGERLTKEPDLIARAGSTFVIGEAKFLTDSGGHQDRQFEDALSFLLSTAGRAIRVALLDGVVWIRGNTKMYRTVCSLEAPALSSLLLDEFLHSLCKSRK